jgi:hypothetical protein
MPNRVPATARCGRCTPIGSRPRTEPGMLRSYEAYERGDIEAAVTSLHPNVEWILPARTAVARHAQQPRQFQRLTVMCEGELRPGAGIPVPLDPATLRRTGVPILRSSQTASWDSAKFTTT